ncbi:hypothetical protein [Pseudozobellia sp. WGM2]|uniref:hypothetical protein n=1 Tax=Pseudozobellia sp. WGM2 TaxID=2787625 RepID=UPI001AE09926|nr:hypothetical protein [Pseudozobellia sp. WGM2]
MRLNNNNKKFKNRIAIESVIIFFVAISPILFKLYDYLPDDPEAKFDFLGFTIENNGFHSVSVYFWFLMSKIIPLYLLIFWFFTSKNWWYHIIIIPIAMYAFQVFEVLFDSDDNIDTENIWWLLPICMLVIPFVYFIRIKLYDKYVHGIDLEAMEAELKELKQKQANETAKKMNKGISESEETMIPNSISEEINEKLSTHNLSSKLKKIFNFN